MIALRIGLALVGLLSIHLFPTPFAPPAHNVWGELLSMWQRWDEIWYRWIAQHGYRAGDDTTAFFPLFPLLSRVVSIPLAGHIVPAELLVSSLAYLAAMWLLYKLARLDVGPLAATLTVLLLALFPTAFFLLAPYTESLSLGLTLAAFWFARHTRPWLAGLAGFAAGLTAAQGAFLVLPLAFAHLRGRDDQGKPPGFGLVSAILPPLGLISFTVYQRLAVGEIRSPMAVQRDWGYVLVSPWRAVADSWNYIGVHGDVVEAFNLVCLVGFSLLAAIVLWRRLPLLYTLYVVPYLVLLWTRELNPPLMSVSRLTLVLFPCFIVLALWLARRPLIAGSVLLISAFLQAIAFEYWVHWGRIF